MIEALTDFPSNVVALRGTGHITGQDYEAVVIPAVDAGFKHHPALRLYYQIDRDFAGFDSGAMWDDFKVGMGHFTHWERVAVVTDVDWISNGMKVFAFLMPGDVRHFALADADQARAWIVDSTAPSSHPLPQDTIDNP